MGGAAGDSNGDDGSGGKRQGSGGRAGVGGEATGGDRATGGSESGGASGGRSSDGGSGSGGGPSDCSDQECGDNSSCVDKDGEPVCECDDGYEEDGDECVDIDECEEETPCGPDARCENREGDYECICKTGFVGDGQTCVPRTRLASGGGLGVPGNSFSQSPALSADGHFVAFQSDASDLVPGDTNGESDVFVFDRMTGTLERVSVDSSGEQTNDYSSSPALSGDGRYVVFASYANNLVTDDTNGAVDVFRHDRMTRATIRVTVPNGGGEAIGGEGWAAFPTVSTDGNRVAFTSGATNLVSGDTNNYPDQFVRDVTAQTTTRVSVATDGTQVSSLSATPNSSPQISGNGRYVVFVSKSPILGGDPDQADDIFRRDLQENVTWQVSYPASGQGNDGNATNPSPSADGRFVAFRSASSTLVPGDTNGVDDVFLRDVNTGAIERVSVGNDGAQGNGQASLAFERSVSNDGRYVVFSSSANNLVEGDTNGFSDVFVRDRVAGTTIRVSVGPSGEEGDGPSSEGTISASGRVVAFQSLSQTFGADGQGRFQIWVRDLSP